MVMSPAEIRAVTQPATDYAAQQARASVMGSKDVYEAVKGKLAGDGGWWKGLSKKGGIGKGIGKIAPYILLYYLWSQAQKSAAERAQMGVQAEGLEQQANMITPEALMYQAAVGPAQEEEQMSRMMLVNKLMGATGPSLLARGEERI